MRHNKCVCDRESYRILKPVGKFLLKFAYRIKVEGLENVSERGGLILASNHVAALDPVMIGCYVRRQCHFMAKSEIFKNRLIAAFLRSLNAFPVERGKSDTKALDYAAKVITDGNILGIFPEGGLQKDLVIRRAKNGVSYLARKTGADVLPVCIYKEKSNRGIRKKITLRFGKVIRNEEFSFGKDNNQAEIKKASGLIMERITELFEKGHLF